MATHSSILAWRIPWTEEPCGLQSMGVSRVGHDWVTLITSLSWSPLLQTGFLRPKGLFLQSDPGQNLTVHPAFCVSLGCFLRRVTFSPLPSSPSAPWRWYTRADSPTPSSKVTFKTKDFGYIRLMSPVSVLRKELAFWESGRESSVMPGRRPDQGAHGNMETIGTFLTLVCFGCCLFQKQN